MQHLYSLGTCQKFSLAVVAYVSNTESVFRAGLFTEAYGTKSLALRP